MNVARYDTVELLKNKIFFEYLISILHIKLSFIKKLDGVLFTGLGIRCFVLASFLIAFRPKIDNKPLRLLKEGLAYN